jgi:hypothetical protein
LKISAPSKEQKFLTLRIGTGSNSRAPGRRVRQSAISNVHEHSGAALAAELSDKSVTTDNQMVRRILEDKLRTLIGQRNAILDAPSFASNIHVKGEIIGGDEAEDLEGSEVEDLVGNEDEDLVAIDNKLDALEHHLDGHNQVAQRFGRTKEILATLDRKFAEYRRILEDPDDATR